jgi:hypothetical protein
MLVSMMRDACWTTSPETADEPLWQVIITHAMADLVVNMEHVLSRRKVATNVHAPTGMTAMLASTRNSNVAAPVRTSHLAILARCA